MQFKRDVKEKIAQTLLNFENITLSEIETQQLLANKTLDRRVDENDALIIKNLINAFDFIENLDLTKVSIDVELYKKLNGIIALDQALYPGELREGNVFIPCINEPIPPAGLPDIEKQIDKLNKVNKHNYKEVIANSFMSLSRLQPFNDGNKRTALFICNVALAKNDLGSFSIPNEQYDNFERKLTLFYRDSNAEPLKHLIETTFVKQPSSNAERAGKIEMGRPSDTYTQSPSR